MRGVVLGFLLMVSFNCLAQIGTFQKFYGGGGFDDGKEIIEVENGAFVIVGST